MRLLLAIVLVAVTARAESPRHVILAVGAHAGDMELTTGALLARQSQRGDRVVILHLTAGEGGNPKLSPELYGAQKRREATEAAKALGAEPMFGPYRDGELPNDEESRRFVARVIRQVRPTHVFTHARNSMHKDHAATHAIVDDAVLLASLEGVDLNEPAWRGIRGIWYAENWEDAEGFTPYLYVDVSDGGDAWRSAVTKYEFVRGGISTFAYLDYYTALQALRGAEVRKKRAVAFDVSPYSKRQVIDELR
jgi:N-acetylglucosamine malate deacetylase 1